MINFEYSIDLERWKPFSDKKLEQMMDISDVPFYVRRVDRGRFRLDMVNENTETKETVERLTLIKVHPFYGQDESRIEIYRDD